MRNGENVRIYYSRAVPRKRYLTHLVPVCVTILAFLIAVPVPDCFCQGELESPDAISFQRIWSDTAISNLIFADFNKDGRDEYVATIENILSIRSLWNRNASTMCVYSEALTLGRSQALDITGDRIPEIFIPVKQANKVWIEVRKCNLFSRKKGCHFLRQTDPVSGLDITGDGVWDGEMEYCQVLDVNDDGQLDILASVLTGYDKNPRGVMAFDGTTGKESWKFSTAGPPGPLFCTDVNSDGKNEIVFGTWAPCNGNWAGDMDDCHSYLVCLTCEGKLVWKNEMGGSFTSTDYVLGDVDNDGEIEIVCTYASGDGHDNSTQYQLQIVDGKTGDVESSCGRSTRFGVPFAADLNGDGRSEIVVTNANGFIYVFGGSLDPVFDFFERPYSMGLDGDGRRLIVVTDADGFLHVYSDTLEDDFVIGDTLKCDIFQHIRETRKGHGFEDLMDALFATGAGTISEIVDLNQDGKQEIIVCVEDNLLIFDSQLRLVGKHQTNARIDSRTVHFLHHPRHGGLISLIQGAGGKLQEAFFLKIVKPDGQGIGFSSWINVKTKAKKIVTPSSWHSPFMLLFMLTLGIAGTLVVLKALPGLVKGIVASTERRIEERRDGLLETLSVFGHGKAATANLDRLVLLSKNLPKDQPLSPEYKRKIDESVKTYFDLTSQQISAIIKKSRYANIGKDHTKALENTAEDVDVILRDYTNQGIVQNQIEKLSHGLPLAIETAEKNIEALRGELGRYYNCDVVATVQEVLAAVLPAMKKENIEFGNLHVEGDVGGKAFIDKSDFAIVAEELINNATYSMSETSEREMIVGIFIDETKIFVRVSDTGCGIKKEDFRRIFDREYSTKMEGGFGLYHAKTVLNKYGGKIKVLESGLGGGTTMQLEVRRV